MKIEASIRKSLIKKFKGEIAEGQVYRILFFDLPDNRGSYRASSHEFQIQFSGRTKVFPDHSDTIPMHGFSFKTSQEIALTLGDSDYLVGEYVYLTYYLNNKLITLSCVC